MHIILDPVLHKTVKLSFGLIPFSISKKTKKTKTTLEQNTVRPGPSPQKKSIEVARFLDDPRPTKGCNQVTTHQNIKVAKYQRPCAS